MTVRRGTGSRARTQRISNAPVEHSSGGSKVPGPVTEPERKLPCASVISRGRFFLSAARCHGTAGRGLRDARHTAHTTAPADPDPAQQPVDRIPEPVPALIAEHGAGFRHRLRDRQPGHRRVLGCGGGTLADRRTALRPLRAASGHSGRIGDLLRRVPWLPAGDRHRDLPVLPDAAGSHHRRVCGLPRRDQRYRRRGQGRQPDGVSRHGLGDRTDAGAGGRGCAG